MINHRWLTSTVIDVASAIRETKEWRRLPLLADALEEAVCDDVWRLFHFRWSGDFWIHNSCGFCWMVEEIIQPFMGSCPNTGYCGIPENDNDGVYLRELELSRANRNKS